MYYPLSLAGVLTEFQTTNSNYGQLFFANLERCLDELREEEELQDPQEDEECDEDEDCEDDSYYPDGGTSNDWDAHWGR